jgi:hypothetical protein
MNFKQWTEANWSQYGYRGVDGLKLNQFKKKGLIPNWRMTTKDQMVYPIQDISKPYLFWADDPDEAKTYGDVILRFTPPTDSVAVSKSLGGTYYVTPSVIPPTNIEVQTDDGEWKPIQQAQLQGNFIV